MKCTVVAGLLAMAACGRGAEPRVPSPRAASERSPPGACFLLYEMGVGPVRRAPADACATRISPASTFKIPHALAALDSGVLAGPDVTFTYDGNPDEPQAWKRDHTLASAMRYSVVWYFQRVATLLGPEREREYLARFDYGNQDISGGLTTFWLDTSLRIAPDEQERFMVDLYADRLPVHEETMKTVRAILVQPRDVVVNASGEHPFDVPWPDDAVVSAKTGGSEELSWLVGHVQRESRGWVFVSCVVGRQEPGAVAAIHLAAVSLREAKVL